MTGKSSGQIKFTERTITIITYGIGVISLIIAIGLFIGALAEYTDAHIGKAIFYGIIGTLVGLLGIGGTIGNYRNTKLVKELREAGTAIQATLVTVKKEWQSGRSGGGHYAYDIITQWKNPSDGKEHTFARYGLVEDPNPWLKTQKTITVLVDLENLKRYHIEVPGEFAKEND